MIFLTTKRGETSVFCRKTVIVLNGLVNVMTNKLSISALLSMLGGGGGAAGGKYFLPFRCGLYPFDLYLLMLLVV